MDKATKPINYHSYYKAFLFSLLFLLLCVSSVVQESTDIETILPLPQIVELPLEPSPTPTSQSATTTKNTTTIIPILVYHKLSPIGFVPKKASDTKYNVYQDVFEAQMNYLEGEGYTPLLMRDLVTKQKRGELPNKPVVITFDDGWKSQYTIALPSLLSHHFPATFFIYTDVIGDRAFMNMDDLHTLVASGMEIGGHTVHHLILSRLNQEQLKAELLNSKEYLEKKLSVQVTDFAYPYGNYSSTTIKALITYGYQSGRTSRHDIHNTLKDPYQLNALYAPQTLAGFKKMLTTTQ